MREGKIKLVVVQTKLVISYFLDLNRRFQTEKTLLKFVIFVFK